MVWVLARPSRGGIEAAVLEVVAAEVGVGGGGGDGGGGVVVVEVEC